MRVIGNLENQWGMFRLLNLDDCLEFYSAVSDFKKKARKKSEGIEKIV